MKKLIKNVTAVTANRKNDVIKNACIAIEEDTIISVGQTEPEGKFEVVDGRGGIAMPGLVNAHTHVSMTLLRSYADGLPLQKWLNEKIFPVEDRLTAEDIYVGAQVGMMDMLSSGTTAFADMYYFMDDVARAVEESGMKAFLCRGLTYFDESVPPEKFQNAREGIEFCKTWEGKAQGRIRCGLAPHAIYTTTQKFLEYIAEKAIELRAPVHIHLSETAQENEDCLKQRGITPTKYLLETGLLEVPVLAAHCVHLTPEDISILKRKSVTVAHNPTSNLKLGSGIAPLHQLKSEGVEIALGTDGASSNNNLNMLEEMNLAALVTNGVMQDPTLVQPEDALGWAVNAGAIGFPDAGVLEAGRKADIVLINTDKPHFKPMHNALSNLVFSANAGDIAQVMVNGKTLYKNGEFLTIDKEKVDFSLKRCVERIF